MAVAASRVMVGVLRIALVASLAGITGCSVLFGDPLGPASGVEVCGKDTAFDARVFAALTAAEWDSGCGGGGGGLPPTCTHLRLGADGAFSCRAVSDYVERDQAGGWNFTARSATAGVVCLETGAMMAFELDGDLLRFGYMGFTPGEPLGGGGDRDDLPAIHSDRVVGQLAAHPWTKTNRFDLFRLPLEFTLSTDGTLAASYRDGACAHGGTWSVDVEPRRDGPLPTFIPISEPNTCDLRGNTSASIGAANEQPLIDDQGRLVLYSAAYRAPEVADTRSWFSFDRYSDSIATSGTLDRELSASAPTTIELAFTNHSDLDMNLASLAVQTTALTLTPDGFQQAGAALPLATLDLAGVVIAPGASEHRTVIIAPPAAAEWAYLELDLAYASARQTYRGREFYMGEIAP